MKLGITANTSHTKFPIFIIDKVPCYIKELNEYELSKIKEIKILTEKNNEYIFHGAMSENGIVLITTKK